MGNNNRVPPEEKLLKTIESPSATAKKKRKLDFSPNLVISKVKDFFQTGFKEKRFTELNYINKIMIGTSVIVTIIFISNFFFADIKLNKYLANLSKVKSVAERRGKFSFPQTDLEKTLNRADDRNIFLAYGNREIENRQTQQQAPPKSLGDFSLVGVIWSGNPQAMVEDTKKQKTHLVNQGDVIDGYTIKKIERDSVVLERDGEEWPLR